MPQVDEEAEARERHWTAVNFRNAVETGDMTKMTDGSNWTVLMIASDAGQKEMVEKFLGKGGKMPKVEEKDPHGFQALMLAAFKGHTDICSLLIEKKAEVNAQDNSGETSLMKAAAEGHTA